MIREIKEIVKNYIDNYSFCNITFGIVEADGIRISEKILIPNELIIGNLKDAITPGDAVHLLRNHGGKQFYILEVVQ